MFSKGLLVCVVVSVDAGTQGGRIAFSLAEAKKWARLAQTSYCEADQPQHVEAWTCESCLESGVSVASGSVRFVHGTPANNTQAIVGKLREEPGCFVAIRGTHNWDNWKKDFKAWYWGAKLENYPPCDGCKVHSGFYKYWDNLRHGVNTALREVGCQDESGDPVHITGHSLGGALAHLAAFTLKGHGYKLASMYSFESPRVGNAEFAAAFNSMFMQEPCYRTTHDHDVVVHVPPEKFGFVHVNTEVYFGKTGSDYKVCEETEEADCSNEHDYPIDMFYISEHCGLPAFGDGFNICSPKCFAPKTTISV